MYTTKLFNNKADCFTPTGTLGGGVAEKKKETPSRYLGVQFKTSPPKDKSYFGSYEYKDQGPGGAIRYSEREPVDERKISFGSKDASRRDEFSSTQAVQAFKEKLKKEQSVHKEIAIKAVQGESKEDNQVEQRDTLFDTIREKGAKQLSCNKCRADTYFCSHTHPERKMGDFSTTMRSYGEGLDSMKTHKAMFGRLNVCREFFNGGHLHQHSNSK